MREETEMAESFYAIGPDGVEQKYDTIFTCESDDGKTHYIVYTDHTNDEEGNVRVFASTYVPGVPNMELMPIETDREWKIIETMIEEIQAELKNTKEDEQ